MEIIELVLLSFGLAMDATAASICKGLSEKKARLFDGLKLAFFFGFFQALMPLIGYFLGTRIEDVVREVDHYIAFILLSFLGIRMIIDGIKQEENLKGDLSFKIILFLAIATSIDALAVGVTFAFLNVNIWVAILFIGLITFILSFLGFIVGGFLGLKGKKYATIVGGIVLILIGAKILLEHLGILVI